MPFRMLFWKTLFEFRLFFKQKEIANWSGFISNQELVGDVLSKRLHVNSDRSDEEMNGMGGRLFHIPV